MEAVKLDIRDWDEICYTLRIRGRELERERPWRVYKRAGENQGSNKGTTYTVAETKVGGQMSSYSRNETTDTKQEMEHSCLEQNSFLLGGKIDQ
jgi:hypothetical protein